MITLGIVMILFGWLLGVSILQTLGIITVVVGLVLLLIRPGGRHYY